MALVEAMIVFIGRYMVHSSPEASAAEMDSDSKIELPALVPMTPAFRRQGEEIKRHLPIPIVSTLVQLYAYEPERPPEEAPLPTESGLIFRLFGTTLWRHEDGYAIDLRKMFWRPSYKDAVRRLLRLFVFTLWVLLSLVTYALVVYIYTSNVRPTKDGIDVLVMLALGALLVICSGLLASHVGPWQLLVGFRALRHCNLSIARSLAVPSACRKWRFGPAQFFLPCWVFGCAFLVLGFAYPFLRLQFTPRLPYPITSYADLVTARPLLLEDYRLAEVTAPGFGLATNYTYHFTPEGYSDSYSILPIVDAEAGSRHSLRNLSWCYSEEAAADPCNVALWAIGPGPQATTPEDPVVSVVPRIVERWMEDLLSLSGTLDYEAAAQEAARHFGLPLHESSRILVLDLEDKYPLFFWLLVGSCTVFGAACLVCPLCYGCPACRTLVKHWSRRRVRFFKVPRAFLAASPSAQREEAADAVVAHDDTEIELAAQWHRADDWEAKRGEEEKKGGSPVDSSGPAESVEVLVISEHADPRQSSSGYTPWAPEPVYFPTGYIPG